jgi:PGF-pre-PGF domain-containing protein/PGF-CTERM protein
MGTLEDNKSAVVSETGTLEIDTATTSPGDGDDDDDDDDDDDGDGPVAGGGGGGGGNGNAIPSASTGATNALDNNRVTLEFSGGSGVQAVELEVPGQSGDVTVRETSELDEGVSDPTGRTIRTFEITSPNPSDGSAATVRFRLSQSLVDAFNANPDDLVVEHYVEGQWQTLETTVTTDGGRVILQAQVERFSPFAITEQTAQQTTTTQTATPTSEPTDTATDAPDDVQTDASTATTDTEGTTSTQIPGFGPIVAVLALLAGAFLIARRRE